MTDSLNALRQGKAALGLTTGQLARLWQVEPATLRRWLSGTAPIPGTVMRLLQLEPIGDDGELTAEQARRILHTRGWTQARAAELLGVEPRTVRRWLAKGGRVPFKESAMLRKMQRDDFSG